MRKFTMYPRKYVRATTIEASDVIWKSGDGAWTIEEVDAGNGSCIYEIMYWGMPYKMEYNFNKAMRTANMYAGK